MARTVADAAIMLGALEGAAPDPNDPATRKCPPPAGPRLHEISEARRPEGRAHRNPARVLLRPHRRRRRPTPRGGLERRAGQGDGRRDRRAQGAGRDHRRSGRHPERRRRRSGEQLPQLESVQRLDQSKGHDADCSIVFKYGMKRDFNAWLASLGATAPVKSLTELRAMEHRAPARRRDQVRPGAARHLRRDGRAGRPRALRGRIVARTFSSRRRTASTRRSRRIISTRCSFPA